MIYLYNYDKYTLKYIRTIELEQMPDNYEFCTLTSPMFPDPYLPNEVSFLYRPATDDWENIPAPPPPNPTVELERLKPFKKQEIYCSMIDIMNASYGEHFSLAVVLILYEASHLFMDNTRYTSSDKAIMISFLDSTVDKYKLFCAEIDALTTLEELQNYTYDFNS